MSEKDAALDGDTSSESDTLSQSKSEIQQCSPLLDLPAEIRNMIYKYVLGNWTICAFSRTHRPAQYVIVDPFYTWHRNPPTNKLNVLSTCRQIYTEAYILPFSLNWFQIWFTDVSRFFDGVYFPLSRVQAITKLRLTVFDHYVMDFKKEPFQLKEDFTNDLLRIKQLPMLKKVSLRCYEDHTEAMLKVMEGEVTSTINSARDKARIEVEVFVRQTLHCRVNPVNSLPSRGEQAR
ncbi:hypothetical protein IQ07DRAFT_639622 [Pyrenochaeta sp. DS3sAY3a]|nr:hypothetical protein IQ07DRAFT_639622 [Pyrenochaeta sp. DS3sAY3a]